MRQILVPLRFVKVKASYIGEKVVGLFIATNSISVTKVIIDWENISKKD